jgi:hypothetical protein
MAMAQDIRQLFHGFPFGSACSPNDIAVAENRLGHSLPSMFRDLYLQFDGFTGPTNAAFFYPLLVPSSFSQAALVEHTLFLRSEDYFPKFLHRAVVFGDYGTGPCWAVSLDAPSRIIEWDAEWGEDYEVLEGTPFEIWKNKKEWYESLPKST